MSIVTWMMRLATAALFAGVMTLAACERDDDTLGEQIEEGVEDLGEEFEDLGDDIEDEFD
jgi:hypothetical protein